MPNLVEVSANRKSLEDWVSGVSKNFRRELIIAQDVIRREWAYEFDRQSYDNVDDGWWDELTRDYERRKDKKHPENAGYVLKASGDMFEAYTNGITFVTTKSVIGVSIPIPDMLRARLSEVYRPFNTEPFEDIAMSAFSRAMSRAAE